MKSFWNTCMFHLDAPIKLMMSTLLMIASCYSRTFILNIALQFKELICMVKSDEDLNYAHACKFHLI